MSRALMLAGSSLLGVHVANATPRIDLGDLGPEWKASTNVASMEEIAPYTLPLWTVTAT